MHTLATFKTKIRGIVLSLALFAGYTTHAVAQETYGHTLNLGLGFAYFGYIGGSAPYFTANYEFDVARNFTLAPFLGVTSYRIDDNYYGGYRYYYSETIVPIGVKGVYYFDELLDASSDWDFYAGASLGFAFHKVSWQDGYYGDRNSYRHTSSLYADLSVGAEYHINPRLGIYLDLSTGVSTVGLAIHGNGGRRHVNHNPQQQQR